MTRTSKPPMTMTPEQRAQEVLGAVQWAERERGEIVLLDDNPRRDPMRVTGDDLRAIVKAHDALQAQVTALEERVASLMFELEKANAALASVPE